MPTGTLPKSGKALWEKVYNDAKAKGDSPEKAAKKAWGAIRQAGWRKDAKGQWHKGDLVEFSLAITKASYDPKTGERRWVAKCSDTEIDSYNDKMSMELFSDFCAKIQENEQAPEEFRSEFWSGGMPYLSVSHYPDLDGSAVPGTVEAVYIDNNVFKSKGTFNDSPLGLASYDAVKKDLLEKSGTPVRISIAFLDYKHKHLSDGYVFERSLTDPKRMICPKCIEEFVTGESGGKEFLRGQLIHLAMTRVPVNKRTLMEVERSEMTTRKQDAASIIGEELAEELDEKAKLVGKSDALVIKAEDEVEEEQSIDEIMDETEPVEEVSADAETDKSEVMKMDEGYVEYRPLNGATSMKEAKKVADAKKEYWRISDLWWTLQDVVSNILSDAVIEDKGKAIASAVNEFKDMLGSEEAINMAQIVLSASNKDEEDMEEDEDGEDEEYKDKKKKEEMKSEVVEEKLPFDLEQFSNAVKVANTEVVQRLDILISALSQNVVNPGIPQRRSLTPPPNYVPPQSEKPRDPNKPMTISEMVRGSV